MVSEPKASLHLKISIGVLFAGIGVWLGLSAPQILILVHTAKYVLILAIALILAFYFFNDPDTNKRRLKRSILNYTVTAVLIFCAFIVLDFIALLIAQAISSWWN